MSISRFQSKLSSHDGFVVVRQFQYHTHHYDILNRLFTPLIGASAIGIYQFLNQFEGITFKEGMTHYTMMSELKMNLIDFRENLDLLEGIGLLKTFVKQTDEETKFIYELIPPPSAYEFFNDPMLSIYFYETVGQQRFHKLKAYFLPSQVDLSGFSEVTKTFTDVFKVPKQATLSNDTRLKPSHYEGLDLRDVAFDFELLADMLQTYFVSRSVLSEPNKSVIIQLATLYQLSPDVMKTMILKSLNSDQSLSITDLRKQAQNYYLIENQQQLPALNVQSRLTQASHSKEDNLSVKSWDEWFELMNQTSPLVMLTSYGGSEPPKYQKEMIEELMNREGFGFGVINVLLQYVMQKTDRSLPEKYVYSVASTWKKSGVTDAKSAYQKAMEVQKNQEQAKNKKYKESSTGKRNNYQHTKEVQPRWITHPEEFEQKNEDQDALAKDRAAFLNKLKNKRRAGED
ncbi:helicase DnaB [Staphylococcus felis]|uniref:DnaD domain protein n=1 Tax=Staphylococcus felis TaxID=46127 RepID=A0AAX1RXT4_9STAP|nr:DnaD domain protein [Staphylococcus felis]MBH9580916.1 DnaD domain protein [Staphylococcus felis]MDM8327271.1 DnaD domain protein [Staphylococcus felis]REH78914.1 helicase DnaB [Staphylococcus felis]REH83108.1 helicase DnaB [Staphylococcus felis]REH85403.1 helicase DnaB [Staphylococcus felis]